MGAHIFVSWTKTSSTYLYIKITIFVRYFTEIFIKRDGAQSESN